MYLNFKQFHDVINREVEIFEQLPKLLGEIQKPLVSYCEQKTLFIGMTERSSVLSVDQKADIKKYFDLLEVASLELRDILGVWVRGEDQLLGANRSTLEMIELMLGKELVTKRPEYNSTMKMLYGATPVTGLKKVIIDLHDFFGGFFNNKIAGFLGLLDMITFVLSGVTNPNRPKEERDPDLDKLFSDLKRLHQETMSINMELQKVRTRICEEINDLKKAINENNI